MPLRDGRQGRTPKQPKLIDGPSNSRLFGLATILVALLLGGGWLYWKSQSLQVKTDKATLCPVGRSPVEVLAILLDVSDQLSEPQLLKIQNEVQRLRDSLPVWGLVDVYVVARGGERLAKPVLTLCNPGNGAEMNRLYQNPEMAAERWKAFATKFGDRIRVETGLPDTDASPIFESIQAISLRTFDRPELDGVPKRLVVVSDLMQNVPGSMSQYQGVPDFTAFAQSPYFSRIRADLDGVQVTLLYLARSGLPVQGPAHVAFWGKYFASQGATVQEVKKVFGDQ